MSNYIERHFDYVLGPSQDARLASVAAGQYLELQLPMEPDAPFVMRSRATRVQYDSERGAQLGLNRIKLQWADSLLKFRSQNLVRETLLSPYAGQLGNPIPVNPEVFYPTQSSLRVNFLNDGAAALTNVTMYFRGVKLFQPGSVKAYQYPDTFGTLPFTYRRTVPNVPVTTNGLIRVVFQGQTDGDFVFRSGQAGFLNHLDAAGLPVREVFIQLKDEDEKPYSNAPVHVDVLFGNSGMDAIYPAGSAIVAPVGAGPASPGLIYPEIIIPKNHVFYFDITRSDASFAEAAAVNFPVAFSGCKVFNK